MAATVFPPELDDAGLERLVADTVTTVVMPVVQRTFRHSPALLSASDDVVSDVRLRLVERLGAWRNGTADPVDNVAAYAATAATHACYGLLRQRFPLRTRLRNRIRYVLTHQPSMTLLEEPPGIWRCGVASPRRVIATGTTQRFLDSPRAFAGTLHLGATTPLPVLIEGLLGACETPIEFDRLVDAVAEILGVSDVAGPEAVEPADQAPVPELVLEQRTSLRLVWNELVTLPARQRAALLLNMRDPEGGGVLELLPTTGVVTFAEIAAALEVSLEELRDLWALLPLDDLTIATRLGITRQQVINLRKSGRARLSRRLAGNIDAHTASSRSMGFRS